MIKSKNKQTGTAAIWFALVAVAILSMGALGVEGARYITEKAHLGDVMEATAIAVSESDDTLGTNSFDPQKVEKLAKAWANYLVPDNTAVSFNISREKIEDTIIPDSNAKRTAYYYKIDSSLTQESWMHMASLPSFEKQQTVYNKATAARIRTDFEPVDVVFVADFSGSMTKYNRIGNLKGAIKDVTQTIYKATKELKKKHGSEVRDSSFGFVPFSKRIVVEKNGSYYCSSMLLPPLPIDNYASRPRLNQNFSNLIHLERWQRDRWYKQNNYLSEEKEISEQYRHWLSRGGSSALKVDRNQSSWKYSNHIDYYRTANDLQLGPDLNLVTPIKMGSRWFSGANSRFCSTSGSRPAHYMIPRSELITQQQIDSFNNKISKMWVNGGTDMYQGLLAAPHQFHDAKNKNRFIFVLSDGAENNDSFKRLVNNGLCRTLRKELGKNSQGENVNFEMFVIGLKFNNNDKAYKDCFGKHIYEVKDLKKLQDVIMELLSNTTSYNVER